MHHQQWAATKLRTNTGRTNSETREEPADFSLRSLSLWVVCTENYKWELYIENPLSQRLLSNSNITNLFKHAPKSADMNDKM